MMNRRGVVLSVVTISLLSLTVVAQLTMVLAFNQSKVLQQMTGDRIISYYRGQAGVVDAIWRIRQGETIGDSSGLTPAGSFSDGDYEPDAYGLNIDPLAGAPPDAPPIVHNSVPIESNDENGNGIFNEPIWARIDSTVDVVVVIGCVENNTTCNRGGVEGVRSIRSQGRGAV